jgi:WD40 repeat protein
MNPVPLPIDPLVARLLVEFKHSSPLIGCRFDPSGRFLFVSAQDNTLQRYDLISGRKTPLAGHQSWVRGMAFLSPYLKEARVVNDYERARVAATSLLGARASLLPQRPIPGFTLISGDYHGKLLWWAGESNAPAPIRSVEAHSGWVRAVAASPDGQTIASCGNDHLVKLWTADGRLLKTLEGHTSHVYNIAFHPDGVHLVSGDLKGIIKDWDLNSGTVIRELDAKVLHKYDPTFMADIGGERGMAFNKDGSQFACCGITNVSNAFAGIGNPTVLVCDWKDGKFTELKTKPAVQGTAWGVDFLPGGQIVGAGGGGAGKVWFWKAGESESMHVVNVPVNVRDMSLNAGGDLIACACFDGAAKVYTLIAGPPSPKKK